MRRIALGRAEDYRFNMNRKLITECLEATSIQRQNLEKILMAGFLEFNDSESVHNLIEGMRLTEQKLQEALKTEGRFYRIDERGSLVIGKWLTIGRQLRWRSACAEYADIESIVAENFFLGKGSILIQNDHSRSIVYLEQITAVYFTPQEYDDFVSATTAATSTLASME